MSWPFEKRFRADHQRELLEPRGPTPVRSGLRARVGRPRFPLGGGYSPAGFEPAFRVAATSSTASRAPDRGPRRQSKSNGSVTAGSIGTNTEPSSSGANAVRG